MSKMHIFAAVILASPMATRAETLLEYDGRAVRSQDLSPAVRQNLYDIEAKAFRSKMSTLEELVVLDRYFEDEAKRRKKTREQIEAEELKVGAVSEKEAKEFYEKNKARIPYPFENVKEEIQRLVSSEQVQNKKADLLKKIIAKKKVKFHLAEPQAPLVDFKVDAFARKGKKGASVQLVEFADYQCPHCRHAAEAMKKIIPKYESKIDFVFVDFPINPSGVSRRVAEGAHCAGKQDKFWEFHYLAFDKQATLNMASPTEFAKTLKLKEDDFKKCLDSAWAKGLVDQGRQEGERVGVSGTPSLYLNGRKILAHDEQGIREEIDRALKSS